MGFKWSYSALGDYEKCPALYRYKHVERLPEVKGPALDRGIKIHETIEHYIKGLSPELPSDFNRYKHLIDEVKGKPGLVVEDFWALNRSWQNTTPRADDAWWRGKLDAYWREGDVAHVLDWKTGKIYDSNRDQMKLYAGVTLARDPEVSKVVVELVYLDAREAREEDYTREHFPLIQRDFNRRAYRIEEDKTFRARPGQPCKWCSFSKAKGGPCSAG